MINKRLILVALTCIPSGQVYTWPLSDHTLREGTYLTAALVATGALAFTYMNKKALQTNYDAHLKRFKNQELLSDGYEKVLDALADYKDYVEIIERSKGPEDAASQLCHYLTQEFSSNAQLLHAFKKAVLERKQELEKKNKEVERALIGWEHNKKKALLTSQGPLLKSTYSLILSTLDTLHKNIPYIEAQFFAKDHKDLYVEERALEKYLSDSAQLKYQLDKLIRSKARVGERYPFRAYAQWVDHNHELIGSLKKELETFTYYTFQQPTVTYVTSTYAIFDILKKQIKSSPEFEAECAQFNAELLARAREDENRKLKETLDHMKKEINTLKKPVEGAIKA